MRVILIGFPRVGKSLFGRRLSRKLDIPFIDLDGEIGKGLQPPMSDKREVYLKLGARGFRKREREVLERYPFPKEFVLATGGGAILTPENRRILSELGEVIYLKREEQWLKEKLMAPPIPLPLEESSWELFYASRVGLYDAACDVCVSLDGLTEAQIVEALCQVSRSTRCLSREDP